MFGLGLVPGLAAAQNPPTAQNVPILPPQVPIAPQFSNGSLSETLTPQQALRSAIRLIPSVTISEEYNDNILLERSGISSPASPPR